MNYTKNVQFEKELTELINKYSMENGSNTPDFVLAKYLMACLYAYEKTIQSKEQLGSKR